MSLAAITRYLVETFDDVQHDDTTGDVFYFHGADRMIPFATIVTRDNDFDHVSRLDRPGVYRLNVGVSPATQQAAVDPAPEGGHDHSALDRLMPHWYYGRAGWVSVLNPSPTTFEALKPLLAEAYQAATKRQAKRAPRA
jgi:predicted DNA-binding protein (MmcQ/YjbR family)